MEQVGWLLPRAPLSPPPLLALFSFNLGCYPPKGRSGEKTVLKNGNVVLLFLTSCCNNMFRGRNLYLPGNNTAFSYDPPPFSTSLVCLCHVSLLSTQLLSGGCERGPELLLLLMLMLLLPLLFDGRTKRSKGSVSTPSPSARPSLLVST